MKKPLSSTLLILIAVALSPHIGLSATLLNGSFEAPAIPDGSVQFTTLTSWTGGGPLFRPNSSPFPHNGFNWPLPQDGAQYEDIGNAPGFILRQAFGIAAPESVIFSWYDNTADDLVFPSIYTVRVADSIDNTVASMSFDAYSAASWQFRTLTTPTLSSGTYTLEFRSDGNGVSLDTLIDNVTASVPEPTTFALISIGAALLSYRRRTSA